MRTDRGLKIKGQVDCLQNKEGYSRLFKLLHSFIAAPTNNSGVVAIPSPPVPSSHVEAMSVV